jgi:hypothetical protein
MSRKIAPTLAYILDQRESADLEPEALRLGREARAELRALIAVARAARMHSHAEVPYDPIDESRLCSICRALSRLSPPRRTGGGR